MKLPTSVAEVFIGRGVFQSIESRLRQAKLGGKPFLISQAKILNAVDGIPLSSFTLATLPDGEKAKSLKSVSRLIDEMAAADLSRGSVVLALGGGVVGDVAGFAASIYLRGIPVVQIPTTLLAQVDSSIGGKTAVNISAGKNLIGSFHQPRLVIVDPLFLQSLPRRQRVSGLYEALKYGIIKDRNIFTFFEENMELLLNGDVGKTEALIGRSLRVKAAVVEKDEREGNSRRVLNFGHTIGHALEAALGFKRILHGEAVGLGMLGATRIAEKMGRLPILEGERIHTLVKAIGKAPALKDVSARDVLKAMGHDKKIRDGSVHFVLPRRIGLVEINSNVPSSLIRETVNCVLRDSW